MLHRSLLKSIVNGLDYLKYLIVTASSFVQTSLKVTEDVVKFSDIVKPVDDDTFQKLYNAGSKTDWSKRSNIT